MIDISGLPNVDAPTANRINGELRDDVVPGDGQGTPVREDWMNDLYYSFIAIMDKYGFTADDSEEGAVTSQFLSSIMKGLITKERESVAASKTILSTDLVELYEIDTSGGDIILTLPAAAGVAGKTVEAIITTAGAANKFSLKGNVAELINGVNTQLLRSLYDRIKVCSDGTVWHILDIVASYETGWINRTDWTNVQPGSNPALNVDSFVNHKLNVNLRDLSVRFLISLDGTDTNSLELIDSWIYDNTAGPLELGSTKYQVDLDNVKVETGTNGLSRVIAGSGNIQFIDTEDLYYNIVVKRIK